MAPALRQTVFPFAQAENQDSLSENIEAIEFHLELWQIIEIVNGSSIVNRFDEFSAVNFDDINRLSFVPLSISALKYRDEFHALFNCRDYFGSRMFNSRADRVSVVRPDLDRVNMRMSVVKADG